MFKSWYGNTMFSNVESKDGVEGSSQGQNKDEKDYTIKAFVVSCRSIVHEEKTVSFRLEGSDKVQPSDKIAATVTFGVLMQSYKDEDVKDKFESIHGTYFNHNIKASMQR